MTAEILDKKRNRMFTWFKENGMASPVTVTCDECDDKYGCKFVFDPYNIDGDCLADK